MGGIWEQTRGVFFLSFSNGITKGSRAAAEQLSLYPIPPLSFSPIPLFLRLECPTREKKTLGKR